MRRELNDAVRKIAPRCECQNRQRGKGDERCLQVHPNSSCKRASVHLWLRLDSACQSSSRDPQLPPCSPGPLTPGEDEVMGIIVWAKCALVQPCSGPPGIFVDREAVCIAVRPKRPSQGVDVPGCTVLCARTWGCASRGHRCVWSRKQGMVPAARGAAFLSTVGQG